MKLQNSEVFKHPPRNARWDQIHPDDITGGYPGALYNASFAVKREEIAEIMPLLCAAVEGLAPTFLFTLRFVSQASGTLAFTRFPETCVIEIDGFSRNVPIFGPQWGHVIVEGARRMRACLGGENAAGRSFEYSMHWGKLGDLDKAKVWADFGAPGTPGSRIDRWRRTRERLLTPEFAKVLWNKALVDYGLIDPPRLPAAGSRRAPGPTRARSARAQERRPRPGRTRRAATRSCASGWTVQASGVSFGRRRRRSKYTGLSSRAGATRVRREARGDGSPGSRARAVLGRCSPDQAVGDAPADASGGTSGGGSGSSTKRGSSSSGASSVSCGTSSGSA